MTNYAVFRLSAIFLCSLVFRRKDLCDARPKPEMSSYFQMKCPVQVYPPPTKSRAPSSLLSGSPSSLLPESPSSLLPVTITFTARVTFKFTARVTFKNTPLQESTDLWKTITPKNARIPREDFQMKCMAQVYPPQIEHRSMENHYTK